MTVEARGVMKSLVLAASLSAVPFSASLAAPTGACFAVVNKAGQEAVERTPWVGQANAFGSPYDCAPCVLRASVSLFGPQSAIFSVDFAIDAA
jgi:hypothetical protein